MRDRRTNTDGRTCRQHSSNVMQTLAIPISVIGGRSKNKIAACHVDGDVSVGELRLPLAYCAIVYFFPDVELGAESVPAADLPADQCQ
jgi:hypothetical protein